MQQSFVRLAALALGVVACAGRQAPQISPTAKADLDAAFTCAVGAVQGAGYRVLRDDRTLSVRGFIREDLTADPLSLGGMVGGQGSGSGTRLDAGDFPAPYEVDGIDAAVTLDGTGAVKIAAEAYTGVGASAKSGYIKRSASPRGASTLKRVEGCAG
jgi:hypothetical protein